MKFYNMDPHFTSTKSLQIKLLLTFLLICHHSTLYADGEADSAGVNRELHAKTYLKDSADAGNQGTEDIRDPRLPPVIPGEDVNDGSKKIRVWSSAGKVSSDVAPKNNEIRNDAEILRNVVVDTRK